MASPDSIASWIVSVLAAGGGTKFVIDLLSARSKSRKEGAEGSAILVNSASEYARQLTADLKAMREEFDRYRNEQDTRSRLQEGRFREHARWDVQVQRKLLELGEVVPEAPPLYLGE